MTNRNDRIRAVVAERKVAHPHSGQMVRNEILQKWRDVTVPASKSEMEILRKELAEVRSRLDRSLPLDPVGAGEQQRPFDAFLTANIERANALRGQVVAFHVGRGEVVAAGPDYGHVRKEVEGRFPLAEIVFDSIPED